MVSGRIVRILEGIFSRDHWIVECFESQLVRGLRARLRWLTEQLKPFPRNTLEQDGFYTTITNLFWRPMNQVVKTSDDVTHCSHCGKNLSITRRKNQVVDGESVFCCQSCGDLFAWNQETSKKGKWSKTRSPFVALKKVLT